MRISDDRYTRDLLRYELARRLIKHQARTQTIRLWTGLTHDRIRKLYRTYPPVERVRRRRGKSPRQVAFFLRSHRRKFETSVLASMFSIFEALPSRPDTPSAKNRSNVTRGLSVVDAYEAYSALLSKANITFEHAELLLEELESGNELQVAQCAECTAVVVVDRLSLLPPCCTQCRGPG